MAIVTVDDIQILEGRTFTDAEIEQTEFLIDLVQGEMESYTGRSLEVREFTETVNSDLNQPAIYLKHTPVVSIESIEVDGYEVDATFFTVEPWGLNFAGLSGLAIFDPLIAYPTRSSFTYGYNTNADVGIAASGGYAQSSWTVTYMAGFDGQNDYGLKSMLIRAVRRQKADATPGGVSSFTKISVEDYSLQRNERLMQQMIGAFTPGEVKYLNKYRRKVSAA